MVTELILGICRVSIIVVTAVHIRHLITWKGD